MSKETSKQAYVAPKLEERGAFAARTLQYRTEVIVPETGAEDLNEFPANI